MKVDLRKTVSWEIQVTIGRPGVIGYTQDRASKRKIYEDASAGLWLRMRLNVARPAIRDRYYDGRPVSRYVERRWERDRGYVEHVIFETTA